MTLTQGTDDTALPNGSYNQSTSLQYCSFTRKLDNVKLLNVTEWMVTLTPRYMALTKWSLLPDFQGTPC
jgi:hypothetical protein